MRAALMLVAAWLVAGCTDDAKSPPADAGRDAAEAGTFEAGSTCISAMSCNVVGDCVRPGTVAACWQCLLNCCIPVTATNDAQKACDAGSACAVSSCDGAGACTAPHPAPEGTPCGKTCGGVFVFGTSSCRKGVCVGDSPSQTPCGDRCYGDFSDCPICDPSGCVASCTPLDDHPDRCLQ